MARPRSGADPYQVSWAAESWPLARVFRISRGARRAVEVVRVTIEHDGCCGRGEGVPYQRYGESMASVMEQLRQGAAELAAGGRRESLLECLPPGAARNALDCALWDLEAQLSGVSVAEQLGLPWPPPLVTAHTVSLDEPQRMGREATQLRAHPLLKLKLGQGPDDLARLEAVRAAAPASSLVVDVNEGWSPDQLEHLLPRLAELGVALVEQPLPAGADEALAEMDHLVPIAADESCHDRHSLAELADRYEVVNIKLDKTGGLTEALALKEQVLQAGLQVMVGCMVSTSLSIVPAMLVAHQAPWVDLDGPAWLAQDRSGGCTYGSGGRILPPEAGFWGKHR